MIPEVVSAKREKNLGMASGTLDVNTTALNVYLLKTDLLSYSTGWSDQVDFPEQLALRDLVELARAATGTDLFRQVVRPGDRVVIKPNLVRDWHPDGQNLYSVITHPTIIRAVVDHVYEILRGDGEIIIADAPMGDTDFDHLLAVTGLGQIVDYYRQRHQFEIGLYDLRDYRQYFQSRPGGYHRSLQMTLSGDPRGYREVDLGEQSAYSQLENLHLLEGTTEGRRSETVNNHTRMANRYLIAGSVLDADVLISVPKLKTHSKVGVTVNCKGMVGINGNKNRLPHYRVGNVSEGGDQFPDGLVSSANTRRMHMGRVLGEILTKQQTIWADSLSWAIQSIAGIVGTSVLRLPDLDPLMAESGNWPGNDTCWRLAADLARIAVFADRDGVMQMTPQRRFLSIVDGIVGGEGDGPLNARPKPCGVLLAGMHPVATDLVSSHLMGLDWRRIPYLRELSEGFCADLEPGFGSVSSQEINTFSNFQPWMNLFDSPVDDLLNFEPPSRWVGQIELRR